MTALIPRLQVSARKYLAGVFYKYFYLREDPISRIINHWVPPPQLPGEAVWNIEYSKGYWDKLLDLSEQAHYAVVRSYILHLTGNGEILDVGCGEGLILVQLGSEYRRYVGVDFSDSALARCPQGGGGTAVFIVGNAENYVPQGFFDVIVFCESVYYFDQPIETVLRYRNYLKESGAFVISLHAHLRTAAIRTRLKKELHLVHETVITNDRGSWFCMLVKPGGRSSPVGSRIR
jgi:2-polyprenyl-6-hydroxyphenyl methylase/3-demethylubiquinone-9 3-methyltransferase